MEEQEVLSADNAVSEINVKPEAEQPGFRMQLDLNELRKKKLFVSTPMYGGVCAGSFTRSMLDLSAICAAHGIPLLVHFLFNESLITRARNYCVDEFLRSGATHLMFIDSDIGFNPMDVLALMSLQTEDSDYDVIGGPYPKKCISWEKIKLAVDKGVADEDPQVLGRYVGDYVFNPKHNQNRIPLNQPCEVLEIGTGFMMIRRRSLEIFADAYQQYLYRPDHVRTEHFDGSRQITQFFQAEIDDVDHAKLYEQGLNDIMAKRINDPDVFAAEINNLKQHIADLSAQRTRRYLSEDYWFCHKVQALGMKVWLCPWMKMAHVGSYIFDGSLADLASIGASATANPDELNKNKKKK